VRTLRAKIGGMLFERTALSKKPEILVMRELANLTEEDTLSPDLVFRDPYFLDFLGLKDAYSEKDLETGILREMEQFILELGAGFSFVARQKRTAIKTILACLNLAVKDGLITANPVKDLEKPARERRIRRCSHT
jgi:predicted nuclease of restriction endonuclease-like (RecB) superfamily